jgi:hypothetical protein
MATMRAMQIAEKGGDFELVEREVPAPAAARRWSASTRAASATAT